MFLEKMVGGIFGEKEKTKATKIAAQEQTKQTQIMADALKALAMKNQEGDNFGGVGGDAPPPPPTIQAHNATYVIQGPPPREFHHPHFRGPQVFPANGYNG